MLVTLLRFQDVIFSCEAPVTSHYLWQSNYTLIHKLMSTPIEMNLTLVRKLLLHQNLTTWIIVKPPWIPAVLWDRVTLTCQGLGTSSATTWYKDGRRWGQQGRDCLTVTEKGAYECNRPGSGLSLPMRVLDGKRGLGVPSLAPAGTPKGSGWPALHGSPPQLVELQNGTELTLFPLQLHHSGRYRCREWVLKDREWVVSAPVTVTVHGENPTASTPTPLQPIPKDLGSLSPLPPISCPELLPVQVLEGPPDSESQGLEGGILGRWRKPAGESFQGSFVEDRALDLPCSDGQSGLQEALDSCVPCPEPLHCPVAHTMMSKGPVGVPELPLFQGSQDQAIA
uniref:Ig-like domain-containing protein n=1 Tax=Zonotrichia albicollis TaxID=44394 RepID=A0A8D2M1W2_ZONAL